MPARDGVRVTDVRRHDACECLAGRGLLEIDLSMKGASFAPIMSAWIFIVRLRNTIP